MFATSFGLIAHILVTTLLALRVLYRKLEVNTTLAWIIVLYALPIGGVIIYFLFGDHRLGRKRMRNGERIREIYQKAYGITEQEWQARFELQPPLDALSKALHADTGFPVLTADSTKILSDTDAILGSILEDINATKSTCFLEFYIIDPQGRVIEVLEAIEDASRRGVECRILADSFGARPFFRSHWPERLRQSGVEVAQSLPVGILKSFSKRSDLRNHRKIIICDQVCAHFGSYNLVDPRFFKVESGVGEWVDVMMRVTGSIVDAGSCIFNTDYLFDTVGLSVSASDIKSLPLQPGEHDDNPTTDTALIQALPSGPEMRHSTIYEVMVAIIFNARRTVRIVTPYFIPDQAISIALTSAAKRGVRVEVIVPKHVDTVLGRYASQASFEELMKAGVHIFKYEGALLHTKLIIIDDAMALFGTVNVDMRSFYLNLELTLVIYDVDIVVELTDLAQEYKSQCLHLDLETWQKRSSLNKFLENTFRLASPLL